MHSNISVKILLTFLVVLIFSTTWVSTTWFKIGNSESGQTSIMMLRKISQYRKPFLRTGRKCLIYGNIFNTKFALTEYTKIIRPNLPPFSIQYLGGWALAFSRLLRGGGVYLLLSLHLSAVASAFLRALFFFQKSDYKCIANAIEAGEIIPWYQPVVNISTGEVSGAEILARWQKPCGEIISPGQFIPEAEKSDLIIPLTRSLMKRAALELSALFSEGKKNWHVGFNVTKKHLMEDGFVTDCQAFLDAFPDGCVKLTIELLEREHINYCNSFNQRLAILREKGIRIALDDFGTGYSNLQYLNEFKVDIIKIDRSFISRIEQSDCCALLLASIIEIGSRLDLEIIVEGVETERQKDWLAEKSISWAQGYYFSPPLPFEKFHSFSRRDPLNANNNHVCNP